MMRNRKIRKEILFVFGIFSFIFAFILKDVSLVYAQATSTNPTASSTSATSSNPYSNVSLRNIAIKNCQTTAMGNGISGNYNGGIAVYQPPSLANDPPTAVLVRSIGINSRLKGIVDESAEIIKQLRERNFSDDCAKVLSYADAIRALSKQLSDQLNEITENDQQDLEKVLEDVTEKAVINSIEGIKGNWATDRKLAVAEANDPGLKAEREEKKEKFLFKDTDMDEMYRNGNYSHAALLDIMKGNSYERLVYRDQLKLEKELVDETGKLEEDYNRNNGILSRRRCTATKDGSDPSNVKFTSTNCLSYKTEPGIVTQERLKQIVNAPYEQALSPSAQAGFDQMLNNINRRISNGTIFDKSQGGDFNAGGDGVGDVSDIVKALENLKLRVTLAKTLYTETRDHYASTTSTCINLPILTRQETIDEVDPQIANLDKYIKTIDEKIVYVKANSSRDYTDLLFEINKILNTIYNEVYIKQVYEYAVAKIKICNASVTTN